MKINKKRKNQKIGLMTIHKQRNNKMPMLEKFLKIFSKKKVTLSLNIITKQCVYIINIKKKFKHYLCLLSFYIYFQI